jgi:hypothetical protein
VHVKKAAIGLGATLLAALGRWRVLATRPGVPAGRAPGPRSGDPAQRAATQTDAPSGGEPRGVALGPAPQEERALPATEEYVARGEERSGRAPRAMTEEPVLPVVERLPDEAPPAAELRETGPSAAPPTSAVTESEALTAFPAAPTLGSISGRVLDFGERFGGMQPARVSLVRADDGTWRAHELRDGRIDIAAVEPGHYRLALIDERRAIVLSEWFAVAPGERVDLGELRTSRPGALRVELSAPLGFEGRPAHGELFESDLLVGARLEVDARDLVARDLSPGRHLLRVEIEGAAGACEEVEILPDHETYVRLEIEPGAPRHLTFELTGHDAWQRLELCIRNSSGRLCGFGTLLCERSPGPVTFTTSLAAGSYLLEASTDSGLTTRAGFALSGTTSDPGELRFALH